jgi:hypothetical protein
MEKNKYYTPKIENLFEGYEFEYQEYDYDKDEYSDQWVKMRFDSRVGLGHDLTHTFNEGRVRVPFLNQEQLESEGWIFKEYVKNPFVKRHHLFEKKSLESEKGLMDGYDTIYSLKCLLDYPYMEIPMVMHLHTEGGFFGGVTHDGIIFDGRCPTINEFRTVCKWLKIN